MGNPLRGLVVLLGVVLGVVGSPLVAETVMLGASRDNTLYEDGLGATSNGVGEYVFSGLTNTGAIRRGLIAFDDVAVQIPAASTILSVTLQLNPSMTIVQSEGFFLHRVSAPWGEGSSNSAVNGGGGGAMATAGDATWLHGIYPATFWTLPGGDFNAVGSDVSSATDALDPVQWSGPGMVADVQGWLDDPASNQGWLLRSNENVVPSAFRFDSRENVVPAARPRLTIEFARPTLLDVPASSLFGLGCLALLLATAGLLLLQRAT